METSVPPIDSPILNVIGEKVALGPSRRDLVSLYHKWGNDFEVQVTLGGPMRPGTLERTEAWWQQVSQPDAPDIGFTIYERASQRPIGLAALIGVDHRHGTTEFVVSIGEKDCWGRGYGTEVTRLMLDYGFTALGLHNIWLRVFSYNRRGIRAYTRAGFKTIGRWREARRFGGQAYDEVLMDCLASEFQSPVLRHLLPENRT